jgi:alpha-methylacyl-CoA racemase
MGPLHGLRVIEMASIGPGPFAGMLLADLGADVVRVEGRTSPVGIELGRRYDTMLRGRTAISLDLKKPANVATVLKLAAEADIFLEGWRPGVAERLGVGPAECLARNPRLIYGRMTGWGQQGPLASTPGHDINYLALSGALHMVGRPGGPPTPPLNFVGDFGGGGMLLGFGVLAALWERTRSGSGQVVDAAMVDGVSLLATTFAGLFAAGLWNNERGTNLVDGGAPYYDAYETADGRYFAIGAIENKFQDELYRLLALDDLIGKPLTKHQWPQVKERVAAAIRTRTREEWRQVFEGTDTCTSPVLTPNEAPLHPHNVARATFVNIDGITQPAPAPRFSRTFADLPSAPADCVPVDDVLKAWGVTADFESI